MERWSVLPSSTSESRMILSTIELTGKSDKVDQFVELMLPLGLVEVSRTGIVAITRGPEGM